MTPLTLRILNTLRPAVGLVAGLAGSVAGGIVMGLIGYYFGQITSRNRTPG
jgi:predicted lipid-binding transport protein (Tim44 family)